jgi:hypothetical protein
MESFMRSSLAGMEIGNFRQQNDKNSRKKFFRNIDVNAKFPSSLPVVLDALDKELSAILAGIDTENTPRKHWKFGKAGNVNPNLTLIEFVTLSTRNFPKTNKILKICNEESQFLSNDLKMGYIYNNYKNTSDNILYLTITYETTIYDYIVSLFKYFFNLT